MVTYLERVEIQKNRVERIAKSNPRYVTEGGSYNWHEIKLGFLQSKYKTKARFFKHIGLLLKNERLTGEMTKKTVGWSEDKELYLKDAEEYAEQEYIRTLRKNMAKVIKTRKLALAHGQMKLAKQVLEIASEPGKIDKVSDFINSLKYLDVKEGNVTEHTRSDAININFNNDLPDGEKKNIIKSLENTGFK